MLAAAAWLARGDAPFAALDHVPRLVSAFLDDSVRLAPPEAAATGRVALFQRVLARVDASDVDPILRFHWLGQSLRKAIEGGFLALVQFIHEIHPSPLAVPAFEVAAASGQLEILQWLCDHRYDRLCIEVPPSQREPRSMKCCFSYQCEAAARRNDRFHVLKWLFERGYIQELEGVGDAAAAQGELEMVEWLHSRGIDETFSMEAIDGAARHGHMEVVKFLHEHRTEGAPLTTLMAAMVAGHSEIVDYLRQQNVSSVVNPESMIYLSAKQGRVDLLEEFSAFLGDDESRASALETAVAYGQLEAAKWLGKSRVSAEALSKAAMDGHLDVLEWVHEEDCGEWVAEIPAQAALAGRIKVVQWIHSHRRELITHLTVDCAAAAGHLDMLVWLYANTNVGCSTDAMDDAASNGHLKVVQWLHEQGIGRELYTSNCMDGAAQHGHLELLVWLHQHGYNRISENAMRSASLDVVMWLHERFNLAIDPGAVVRSIALGDLAFMKWIHANTTVRVSPRLVRLVLPLGHPHMITWMREHRPEEAGVDEFAHAREDDEDRLR